MIKVVIVCMIIGSLLLLKAITMDVSVTTEIGAVNNIGLLAERQNYYIIAGFLLLIGFVVLALIQIKTPEHSQNNPVNPQWYLNF
jgi:hypothetical protein